jgi:uncharacterized membrane protein YqjE
LRATWFAWRGASNQHVFTDTERAHRRQKSSGICLAKRCCMSSPSPQTEEPSLPELLRSIVDQAQLFARAELALLKVEARQGALKAALILAVVLGGSLLLAIALSLCAAAAVLARHGSPAAALLTAAGVDVLFAALATAWLIVRVRKRTTTAAALGQLANSPQHGSQTS